MPHLHEDYLDRRDSEPFGRLQDQRRQASAARKRFSFHHFVFLPVFYYVQDVPTAAGDKDSKIREVFFEPDFMYFMGSPHLGLGAPPADIVEMPAASLLLLWSLVGILVVAVLLFVCSVVASMRSRGRRRPPAVSAGQRRGAERRGTQQRVAAATMSGAGGGRMLVNVVAADTIHPSATSGSPQPQPGLTNPTATAVARLRAAFPQPRPDLANRAAAAAHRPAADPLQGRPSRREIMPAASNPVSTW